MQGRTGAAANLLLNLPQVMAALAAAALIGFVDCRLLILTAAAGCLLPAACCLLSILPMLSKAGRRTADGPASA
ncbi:hypothetical protein [Arthrobacter sulfonylureivorans]|uniref:Major facilitator superfamily (MFS) profile domain-containing protein n=1 Tax=Arthrobacter sulfonylureivorans TaxID=2486855 RepID=A0ABY3W948_9MICC|nr:hypothetical protein [Arthrobacter sulfonylureivorans]UNK45098.1 hypothetical protein MNQ99_14285 [Arthrobacter sulfonylureivorans]